MKSLSKIQDWYISKEAIPYWVIFIIDVLVVFFSAIFIHVLNRGLLFTFGNIGELCIALGVYMPFYILCFHRFHTYVGVVRYSSFNDLRNLAASMTVGAVLVVAFKYFIGQPWLDLFPIRMRDIVIWTIFATFIMCSIRIIVKYWFDSVYAINEGIPTYIYGIRKGGVALAKSIRSQKPTKYLLKGFITDKPEFTTYTLLGEKVYADDEKLADRIRQDRIKAIFVSPMISEKMRENKRLVNELLKNDVKIYMMPSEQEWDPSGEIDHSEMKEVAIEDLLPRQKINVNLDSIAAQLTGKRILITGAAGSIGEEIVHQVAHFNPEEIVMIDQAETPLHNLKLAMARKHPAINSCIVLSDITNYQQMRDIFEEHRPEYVFHAAAYKHVPMLEDNPMEGIHNNVLGTRNIADLAVMYGVKKFVMVSTDKAVNPTNVMGCSKRICEIYVQSLDKAIKEGRIDGGTQFVTTRFGNVLGSNGSVIPLFKEQIKNGGPVTVTHPDIIRYFMLISEACKLVLEAGTMGNGGEIFVFDMGQPVKIIDLAQRMIQLSGANVEIKITGLRNGEKLYEEVLNDQEVTLPTFHEKIKIAKVREYDYHEVSARIREMEQHLHTDDNMAMVRRMKDMVPEYRSQHSVYEILDRPAVTADTL